MTIKKKVNNTEIILISSYVILLPITLFYFEIILINHYFTTALTTSLLLMILTLLNYLTKKPYLSTVFVCHLDQCRTLKIRGKYLPICSRCTGIYLGIFSSLLLSIFYQGYLLLLLLIPLVIDGYLVYKKKRASNHQRRLITGLLFGLGLIYLYDIYHQGLNHLFSLVR